MSDAWTIQFSPGHELRVRAARDHLSVALWSGATGQWEQQGEALQVPHKLIPGLVRGFRDIRRAVKGRA